MNIYETVKQYHSMGASKTSANQMIRKAYEYKSYKEEIDAAIQDIYGSGSTSSVDWDTRLMALIENTNLSKKELVNLLVDSEGGHLSSINQFMGYREQFFRFHELMNELEK